MIIEILSFIPISPALVILYISYSILTTLYFIQPSPTTISSLLTFFFFFSFFLLSAPFSTPSTPSPRLPLRPSLCAPPPRGALASPVELAAPASAPSAAELRACGRPPVPSSAGTHAGRPACGGGAGAGQLRRGVGRPWRRSSGSPPRWSSLRPPLPPTAELRACGLPPVPASRHVCYAQTSAPSAGFGVSQSATVASHVADAGATDFSTIPSWRER